jgi:hypothetical protein
MDGECAGLSMRCFINETEKNLLRSGKIHPMKVPLNVTSCFLERFCTKTTCSPLTNMIHGICKIPIERKRVGGDVHG